MLTFNGNHGSWRSVVLERVLKILHKCKFKICYCYVLKIFPITELHISLETKYPYDKLNKKSKNPQ